jgi:NAD(P)-dependent dehydrogenase (short-subunit alcohol dehydrogenase family)
MKNSTCLITGGESGLGFSFASAIAREGGDVVLLCRNAARGTAARLQLIRESSNPNIDLFTCDFSSLRCVRQLTQTLYARYGQMDVLAHMSGITLPVRTNTPEGLEANLAYNLVSPFLITRELLQVMQHSRPAQILVITGESHRSGQLDPEAIRRDKRFGEPMAHQQSSLARMVWTMELARRLEGSGVTVNAFCPGNPRWLFLDQLSQNLPLALPFADWRSRHVFDRAVSPIV